MLGLSYVFRDPRVLELALTHASSSGERNNERLEFLGDAVLDLVVAEELYRMAPSLPEGSMTQLKAAVVTRKSLASASRGLGLAQAAQIGGGMRGRALTSSVLANLYEAVVGAIFLDGGLEAARGFIRESLESALERARTKDPQESIDNPKQNLQQLAQARWGLLPAYELIESRGRAHARAFLMAARIGERRFPSAWGRTRKEAESWAAHEALLALSAEDSGPAATRA
jgi:ribonuclease III